MRIVMMGTGTFAEPTFQSLLEAFPGEVVGLVTQPAREVGRRGGSTRQVGLGMPMIALSKSIPVLEPESINSEEGLTKLAALNPDLLVVAAYGQILKPSVLAIPKLGAINVHASLLPKYRGAAPVAHAILNGETETGVTIIRITPGLDAGEMLAKKAMLICPGATTGETEGQLAYLGVELVVDVIKRMKTGPVVGEQQDPALATKAPKITKEMGLVDWTEPAHRLHQHVLAMQPWPTPYTFLHKPGHKPQRVIISRARSVIDSVIGAEPGSISLTQYSDWWNTPTFTVEFTSFRVAAGDGKSLVISEIQPAGKRSMLVEDYLKGHPLTEGCRFGPERLS